MSLATLPYGAIAYVVSVDGSEAMGLRLLEMGIVPGVAVRVVRSAPFGDPLQICVRDYHLAIRRLDAERICVTTID